MFASSIQKLTKLQRERLIVKSSLISDASKAILLAQIDAAHQAVEAEIASSGAVQAPSSSAGTSRK